MQFFTDWLLRRCSPHNYFDHAFWLLLAIQYSGISMWDTKDDIALSAHFDIIYKGSPSAHEILFVFRFHGFRGLPSMVFKVQLLTTLGLSESTIHCTVYRGEPSLRLELVVAFDIRCVSSTCRCGPIILSVGCVSHTSLKRAVQHIWNLPCNKYVRLALLQQTRSSIIFPHSRKENVFVARHVSTTGMCFISHMSPCFFRTTDSRFLPTW